MEPEEFDQSGQGENSNFLVSQIKRLALILLFFLASCLVIYFFLTAESQIVKIKYFFAHLKNKNAVSNVDLPQNLTNNNTNSQSKNNFSLPNVKKQTLLSDPISKNNQFSLANLEDNHIIIPKININAPITWNSEVDDEALLSNLQKGVVHYKGTALPDEKGNVFITGHSSYYAWDKGQYKSIFALLNKLQKGDQIALSYKNQVYVYEIVETIVVEPKDTWVLDPTTDPMLTLMTCTPVGTNLRRLIVRSKLISGMQNQASKEQVEPQLTLPSIFFP
ncbi:MAG: class D sortase [Patescibacteria group bacterium]